MKLWIDNPNNCLHCGKKLSIFHLLRDLLYCDNSHRSAHVRAQNELGLSRLLAEEKSQSVIRWERCERQMNRIEGFPHKRPEANGYKICTVREA
jgi:hypothetical protein